MRLCFGSIEPVSWRKQRNLEANGYASHQEWLRDWQDEPQRYVVHSMLGSRAAMRRRAVSCAYG